MQDSMMSKLKDAVARFWDETVLGSTSDVGSQPAPVAAVNEVASLYGSHSIPKHDQHDPDTGLFYSGNPVAFCLEAIVQAGADDDTVGRPNALFTPVPPHHGIQRCLFGSSMLDDQFQAYMGQCHIAVDNGKTTLSSQGPTKRHVEYIYKAKGKPFRPNDNYVVKDIRLLFSIAKAGFLRDAKLVEEMYELRETVRVSLRTANLPSFPPDADGLISFLWLILSPESVFSKEPFPDLCYDDGKSIENQVTALGRHACVKANELLSGLLSKRQGDENKCITVRGLGALQYPQKKGLWEMADTIGLFFDDSLQYSCPFLVCGDVFTFDPNVVDDKARVKAVRTKQNAKSKMAEFQPELQAQANGWDIVLCQLSNGGSTCEPYHTLLLFAPKRVINRASRVALNV